MSSSDNKEASFPETVEAVTTMAEANHNEKRDTHKTEEVMVKTVVAEALAEAEKETTDPSQKCQVMVETVPVKTSVDAVVHNVSHENQETSPFATRVHKKEHEVVQENTVLHESSVPIISSLNTATYAVSTQPKVLWYMKDFPTMFEALHENNITFCIDTSGSMYQCLEVVKDHVTEALFQKANSANECYFNLVEFSTDVTQWSDRQVKCSPQTVAVAAQWIHDLQAKSGTNVLDALLSAFSDNNCDAVYLVTDGQPDQHPSEILDNVAYVSQNRPVHAYYLQLGEPDPASVEFLQELAMETYGSFHVIIVNHSGAVEKVVPVYRAETSAERIIRSTQGNVFSSADRLCSVTTTLDNSLPPAVIMERREPNVIIREVNPWYPYLSYMYPHQYVGLPSYYARFYNNYHLPYDGAWSKWRPTRAFSKFTRNLSAAAQVPPPAPGPGSMVIGTRVLARRVEDGYFYLGSVKSQILSDKFLVEFGPCKHGKYKTTVYQETFIHDMVSHADALRHSLLVGDKVVAPWEPEGERYGPGVVIDGQEKRFAEGGGEDKPITISFSNGKTATVPYDTAVWIPPLLFERIEFELQLPSSVRKEFAEQETYPEENLPGYPVSGAKADPEEFDRHDPRNVQQHRADPLIYEAQSGIYNNPYYVPMYPVYYKYQPRPSAVYSEEVSTLVPGTDLTKDELNEKVMSQLMKYKMSLDDRLERRQESEENRSRCHRNAALLENRKKQEELRLKKSVSFKRRDDDELSDIEAEYYSGDLDFCDSGHGSGNDLELEDLEKDTREIGVNTNSKLLQRGRRSRSPVKPRWQYWNNEPAPDLIEPMHFGPYRVGPYDSTAVAAPLELRHGRVHKEDQEQWQRINNASMYDYVDPYSKSKRDASVYDSLGYNNRNGGTLRQPHPPTSQKPGRDICEWVGEHQRPKDQIREGRLQYRRDQVLAREQGFQDKREEQWAMKRIMRDQHKQRILAQLEHDKSRQLNEIEKIERAREAKKQINTQIRVRVENNQERERERSEQRDVALQNRRARREQVLMDRQRELQDIREKRQALKQERAEVRHQAVNERLASEDAVKAASNLQARQAHVSRLLHFRQLEEKNQQLRDLQKQTADNNAAVFRSAVIT